MKPALFLAIAAPLILGACATPSEQLAANESECVTALVGTRETILQDRNGRCVTRADYDASRREFEEGDRYRTRAGRQRSTNNWPSIPNGGSESAGASASPGG